MKKLYIILILILCNCSTPSWFTIDNYPKQEFIYTNIDSICIVDSLPTDLSKWQ